MTAIANRLSPAAVVAGLTVGLWTALIVVVKVVSFAIANIMATSENGFTVVGALAVIAAVYFATFKAVSARK